jgi:C-terminal processing protease CtpA/Prc
MIVPILILTACGPILVPTGAPEQQPALITGQYEITNDFVLATYYVENAVALTDMHGFVIRDQEWELPVISQVMGFMTFDPTSLSGTYELSLPLAPRGVLNDLDQDGRPDQGVQVFAVAYSPNLYGGPFSEGDDRSRGWPTYLASITTDTENQDEVTGGKLVVWAPDAAQKFPTGFGADDLLFTADDPVGAIPVGYTIVDLDQDPFTFLQEAEPELRLYEPTDIAVKDLSGLSYTDAFDQMLEVVQTEYAFADVAGKAPVWSALRADLRPRVEQAEGNRDANAFYLALRDFTWAFRDGHVSLDGGEYGAADFQNAVSGGYGLAVRELDDGRVMATFALEDGPAALAGLQVGAEITGFNGLPISTAIGAAQSYSIQSSEFASRYQQARYLLRAQPGDQAQIEFVDLDGETREVTLTAVPERESFSRTSLYFGVEADPLLPVEAEIIPQGNAGVGYVRINSNYDDLNLVIRLFERALKKFQENSVAGIVIDMRYNSGGAPLGLAGFLTNQEIPLGQLEYYSTATGKFEQDGLREVVRPNENQYQFDRVALLVGPACFSACEIESYGFSQVPNAIVVGQYPTAGVEAETARGQFQLPEGFTLTVPTGRFTLPDGSIFLEGQGVPPTLRVPVDAATVQATDDVVLRAALQAVLSPAGAGIHPSGPPSIASASELERALSAGAPQLEELARESYPDDAFAAPGMVTYSVPLTEETVIWAYGWCAADTAGLEENWGAIGLDFELDGEPVPAELVSTMDGQAGGRSCRWTLAALTDWPPGEHQLRTLARYSTAVNDGSSEFPAGDYVIEYTVFVGP